MEQLSIARSAGGVARIKAQTKKGRRVSGLYLPRKRLSKSEDVHSHASSSAS
jgi:hypothetical protein